MFEPLHHLTQDCVLDSFSRPFLRCPQGLKPIYLFLNVRAEARTLQEAFRHLLPR